METRTLVSLPELAAVKVVAVYEPKDGQILHVHMVKTFEGGRSIGDEEAVATALKYAAHHGHETARLETVVSSNPEHAASPHRIDLQTRQFVALLSPEPKKVPGTY